MQAVRPSMALIALLAAVVATTPLAIDMYLPAMPQITSQLNTDPGLVQQSLSIYLAFYALGMLIFGPLADAIGRRKLALSGLLGFSLLSLTLSQVSNIEWFLVGRAAQAFVGSAATVVVPGIIRALYQEQTAKGMSYVSMMMMLAPLLAPAIGSALLLIAGWHWIFITLSAYAAIVLLFSWHFLPEIEPPAKSGRLDFLSSYRQVLTKKPAQPLIAISMFASFSFFCFLTAVPFVYIEYFSVDEQLFSLLFGLNVLMLIGANFFNSRLVGRFGSVFLLKRACVSALLFALLLCTAAILDGPLWLVVVAIAPLMASLGISATNADALILMQFPQLSGTATAVIGTLRFSAGALAGPLLALGGHASIVPFALLMASGVLAMLICLFWRQRHST